MHVAVDDAPTVLRDARVADGRVEWHVPGEVLRAGGAHAGVGLHPGCADVGGAYGCGGAGVRRGNLDLAVGLERADVAQPGLEGHALGEGVAVGERGLDDSVDVAVV